MYTILRLYRIICQMCSYSIFNSVPWKAWQPSETIGSRTWNIMTVFLKGLDESIFQSNFHLCKVKR